MGNIFLGLFFLVGLAVGSFVNMLVFRTALSYGITKKKLNLRKDLGGRSYCDSCGKQLSWSENVPVISWLMQGGKTRCCYRKLDWSYPLVELGTGILFAVFVGTHDHAFLPTVVGLVILVFMVFSFVFDAKYMILPDFSTGILAVLTVAYLVAGRHDHAFLQGLAAGLIGLGFIGALWWLTKGKGMGFGDVKLAGFMGLFLGLEKLVIAFYIAFVSGALLGVSLLLAKKMNRKSQLPFGPFLLLGTLIAWWWGGSIRLW